MFEVIAQFKSAMYSAGLTPPIEIIPDGKKHRFSTSNKSHDTAGEYCLYLDSIPAGYFRDYRTAVYQTWCFYNRCEYTPQEKKELTKKREIMRKQKEEEMKNTTKEAIRIWNLAIPASVNHPYLLTKQVGSYGLREFKERLLVPVTINGKLQSLQFISNNGDKWFLPGGRVHGCYYFINNNTSTIAIAEGYATAASIFKNEKISVVIAFNAGNLLPVSIHMRNQLPKAKIVICADDDRNTPGNPGMTKARHAAIASGSLLAYPIWPKDAPETLTDFNDLACWISKTGGKR